MPRPHVPREAEEVRARGGFGEEEVAQAAVPLARVAAPAGGHYVTRTVVPAARLRLNVVHRQLLDGELLAAVDAAAPVAPEDVFTLQ